METLTASYVNAIGTPAVEGLIFRPFRRDTDYPSYLEMLNAAYLEDKIEAVETIEGLTHEDDHLTNCDLNTDALVADIGGKVVGQARVSWWVNDVGERLYGISGNVHPAWRGKGIGRALLLAAMGYLWERGCRVIELTVDTENVGARRLYDELGFFVTGQLHWYRLRLSR